MIGVAFSLLLSCPVRHAVAADQVVLVRDVNGDGAPDSITSGNQVDEQPAFSLLVNRGDGSFEDERLVPTAFGERIEDAGDVDGDGVVDLLASNYWANGISLYRGPRFDQASHYDTATHGGPSLIVDRDIVSFSFGSGNPVRVHVFPRGTAKKTYETNLGNAASPTARRINGTLEILVSEHFGDLGLIRFTNDSIVVTRLPAGPGVDRATTFADVNGDGVADIVDLSDDPLGEGVFVTLGKPDGTFLERRQLTVPRHLELAVALRAGDLDGDGDVDLVVRDFGMSHVYFFRGDGHGDFAEGVPIDVGDVVNDVALGDVNGDGRFNIVTVNDDHSVSVLLNGGPCSPPRRRAVTRR